MGSSIREPATLTPTPTQWVPQSRRSFRLEVNDTSDDLAFRTPVSSQSPAPASLTQLRQNGSPPVARQCQTANGNPLALLTYAAITGTGNRRRVMGLSAELLPIANRVRERPRIGFVGQRVAVLRHRCKRPGQLL